MGINKLRPNPFLWGTGVLTPYRSGTWGTAAKKKQANVCKPASLDIVGFGRYIPPYPVFVQL